jgi:hypothetical protein
MPAKRVLSWGRALALTKGLDWARLTDGGKHHALFSTYLTRLVEWTRAYSRTLIGAIANFLMNGVMGWLRN